jgi:hypothetical protein
VQSGCRFSCYIGSGAKEKGGTALLKKLLGEFLKWTLPVIFKCYDQPIMRLFPSVEMTYYNLGLQSPLIRDHGGQGVISPDTDHERLFGDEIISIRRLIA